MRSRRLSPADLAVALVAAWVIVWPVLDSVLLRVRAVGVVGKDRRLRYVFEVR